MNNRIKEIRKRKGLNQTEFGARLGLSRDTVANIEGGRIEIKDVYIKSICNEFGVSESWLRTGEGDMFLQMDPEDELMEWAGRVLSAHPQDFQKRFVKMLMGLTDDQWHIMEAKILELAAQYDDEDKKEED